VGMELADEILGDRELVGSVGIGAAERARVAEQRVPMFDDDYGIEVVGPRMGAVALGLLPEVFARIAAGDPGDPQPTEGITWAGHFAEDYATVDWSQPARRIHDQADPRQSFRRHQGDKQGTGR